MAIKIVGLSRAALGMGLTAAMLAGCGGSQPQIAAPGAMAQSRAIARKTDRGGSWMLPTAGPPSKHTFKYTGTEQSFKVPNGVREVTVVVRGAAGAGYSGSSYGSYWSHFGRGGRVYAVIPVRPRERLYVFVGGQGTKTGGFNGGGRPGWSPHSLDGFGGGGASDVREGGHALRYRILVAAGGGGQGCCYNDTGAGGNGGPDVGEAGSGTSYNADGGGGGTQSQGGAGGSGEQTGQDGLAGQSGSGGRGGNEGRGGGCNRSNYRCIGGAGGGGAGGYFGGGGGGGGVNGFSGGLAGAGGGGGSSYVESTATKLRLWRGWKNAIGDGLVVFSWQ